MGSYQILWEGNCTLSAIQIEYKPKLDYTPDSRIQAIRDQFWAKEKERFPDIYDGMILFCQSLEFGEEEITINVGLIKYSFLNIILREGIEFDGYKGYLAFRSKLNCGDSDKFIIGQKSKESQFDPLHYTFPGGLFEYNDLDGPISVACQREIEEEIGIEIDHTKLKLKAINKHRRNNGVILEIEGSVGISDCDNIQPNTEWKQSGLRWTTFKDLESLPYNLLHDDIRYFIDSLQKKT